MTSAQHVYVVRPRRDKRGVDLISDALPFGRLWYTKPDDAIKQGDRAEAVRGKRSVNRLANLPPLLIDGRP